MSANLVMEGDMTIVNAAIQREQLLAAVQAAPTRLTLDMRQVDGVDSAGLQLLLATQHSLARTAAALVLDGVQPAVANAMGVYGLQPLLLADTGASA